MRPEPGRVGAAPLVPRAYSGPRGTARTGPAPLLLPRVHAADMSPSPPSRLPANIGQPEIPVTGWERVKELFDRDAMQKVPEELIGVINSFILGGVVGFLYGGLSAGRHARQRYIQGSQAELYTSRVEAVRSAHNAAIRGFVRYGWRWSWRVAVIVTLFNSVNTGLCVYRDRDALSNYVAAGAVTVGLFRVNLGLRGLVAGGLIGAVLGVPVGVAILGLQSLSGETLRERKRRERRELHQNQVSEWAARLQLTDELISDLNISSQPQETTRDLQRIQELLHGTPTDPKDQ